MKKDFSNGTIPSSVAFLDASLLLIKGVCRPSMRMSLYSYVRPSVHYAFSKNGKNVRFSRLRWQEIILRDTPANATTTAAAATTTAATITTVANTATANTATTTIAKCKTLRTHHWPSGLVRLGAITTTTYYFCSYVVCQMKKM